MKPSSPRKSAAGRQSGSPDWNARPRTATPTSRRMQLSLSGPVVTGGGELEREGHHRCSPCSGVMGKYSTGRASAGHVASGQSAACWRGDADWQSDRQGQLVERCTSSSISRAGTPHSQGTTGVMRQRIASIARAHHSQRSPSCWPGGTRGPAVRLPESCGKFSTVSYAFGGDRPQATHDQPAQDNRSSRGGGHERP
jgi:hypothetical protein